MIGSLFKSRSSIAKVIDKKLSKNKPLKNQYGEFEVKAQAKDITALKHINVLFKLDKALNDKESSGLLNSEALNTILALSTVHPFGRIAYSAVQAISFTSELMIQANERQTLDKMLEITKSFDSFDSWPSIYDYMKMNEMLQLEIDSSLDSKLLGIPRILIGMSKELVYESENPIADKFLNYVENGADLDDVNYLLNEIGDEEALDWYDNSINLVATYGDISEVRRDLDLLKEHIDSVYDIEDAKTMMLYKLTYDLLYREVNKVELYKIYIEAYVKLTGDVNDMSHYAFNRIVRRAEYSHMISVAPLTAYDIHCIVRLKEGSPNILYKIVWLACANSESISQISMNRKNEFLEKYMHLERDQYPNLLDLRLYKEVDKMYTRIIAEMERGH